MWSKLKRINTKSFIFYIILVMLGYIAIVNYEVISGAKHSTTAAFTQDPLLPNGDSVHTEGYRKSPTFSIDDGIDTVVSIVDHALAMQRMHEMVQARVQQNTRTHGSPSNENKGEDRRQNGKNSNCSLPNEKASVEGDYPRHGTKVIPSYKQHDYYDCQKLIHGDQDEIDRLEKDQREINFLGSSDYNAMTESCEDFKKMREYTTVPLSDVEENFPIAYSILMYKDISQVERLLRAIYQPQNFYCIHMDSKTEPEIQCAMRRIASCFHNVFIASRQVNVRWATFSVLLPELVCMHDLWKYKSWKYFINLTGQEFPLKTNAELVRILMAFNGSNNVEGSVKRNKGMTREIRLKNMKSLPFAVNFTTGQVHIAVQRGFVHFVLHNKKSSALLKRLKGSIVPDEVFFTTLNYNPQLGVPGSYLGEKETDDAIMHDGVYPRNPYLARLKNWDANHTRHQPPFSSRKCYGKIVRKICIYGYGDLQLMVDRPELFANKFHMTYQPEAYSCLEELIFNRTREQQNPNYKFDMTYYENLDFVRNHI